jgi:phosphatidate phosphatase APP1
MKPLIRLYRGYANEQELIVMGHVIAPTTRQEYDFQKSGFKHARNIIRVFRVKTSSNAEVHLECGPLKVRTKTLEDGHFKFCIPLEAAASGPITYGWQPYEVYIEHNGKQVRAKGTFIRPHEGRFGFISDIDDTFLVSHTRNAFKKLYVLLFRNLNKRKIFEDVVAHYQALSTTGKSNKNEMNAFFYVSSSEWNLYRFIVDFTKMHDLPRAVMLLKDIKTSLTDFFLTGRGNHNHKFEKIRHILEFYPNLKYTLLGDDSQEDPFLYEAICKIFPVTVMAVYIRQTGSHQKPRALAAIQNMETMGVKACYFKDSSEAIEHSRRIGLIS